MPGPAVRLLPNAVTDAMTASPSVFDSPLDKALRMIGGILGVDDPLSQVLGIGAGVETADAVAGPVAKAVGRIRQKIRAFHGSPHDFDKFSMAKIGTGEGAQAYGHGLYFAEKEAVAKDYRDRLTDATAPATFTWRGQDIEGRSGPVAHAVSLAYHDAPATARRIASEGLAAARNGEPWALEMGGEGYWAEMLSTAQQIGSKKEIAMRQGRMYEVAIDADPDALLDLDKPLSKQPAPVKAALRQAGLDQEFKSNLSDYSTPMDTRGAGKGQNFVAYLQHAERQKGATPDEAAARASERLLGLGIPGARYLDAGSRSATRGTRNIVVFDDSLVDIIRKYGVAVATAAGYTAEQIRAAQAAQGAQQ